MRSEDFRFWLIIILATFLFCGEPDVQDALINRVCETK